jgi:glycosyltransferase involved in cell wall biosynthesis
MRIGHVVHNLESFGGLETFIQTYSDEFKKLGHEVSLIPLYPFKKPNADVLLVHFGRPSGALYGAFLSEAFNIPYVALLHGHTDYVKELVKQLKPKYQISLSDETHKHFPHSTLIRKGIDTELFKPSNCEKKYKYIFPHRNTQYKGKAEGKNILRIEHCPYELMPEKYNLCEELLSLETREPVTYTVLEAASCGLKTTLTREDVIKDYNIKIQVPKLLEYINDIALNK